MSSDHVEDYSMVVKNEAGNVHSFRRLTFTGRRRGQTLAYAKVIVRPVRIKDSHHLQFSYFDAKKDVTRNHSGEAIASALDELLEMPFKQIHLQTAAQDIRIQLSNSGEARISSGKPTLTDAPSLAHNRTKDYLISGEHSKSFLHRIQIADANGDIKPTMQSKYRQIHEFLSRIEPIISDRSRPDDRIDIVDCGCGSAYLTFAAFHYLKFTRNLTPHIVGIDRDPSTIDKCRTLRDDLGWKGLDFFETDIANFEPEVKPELVLSLHACNTATDEAIARGINWESQAIVVAPCCQHELRPQIQAPAMQAIIRYGLLKQRTAEIVTDAVRAQILRIMGYKTGVVEFVYPSHTPKNLMIRAQKVRESGDVAMIREYLELRDYWHVEPRLEKLIGDSFLNLIERYRETA